MPNEYQIKLAASKPEVPVNFLVEMILGVPAETLENSRPQYDPDMPWKGVISLLPGAGKVGFPGDGDQFPPIIPGEEEWLAVRAYIFLTQCMALKFDLKESKLLESKIPTLEFAQWVKQDEILERLEDMEADVCEQAVWFIESILEKENQDRGSQQVEDKPPSKERDKGGNPSVDPEGVIAAKIAELKSEGIKDSDIPWDLRFTKLVQKLKSDKIDDLYKNMKIQPRIKGTDYTARVGICLDTAKKLILKTSN